MKIISRLFFISFLFGLLACSLTKTENIEIADSGIKPDNANPQYWNYKGKKVLLLGGSREDNLFQIPDIEDHLDILKSCGGNYVRNTMSSRDEGDAWPFKQREDSLYDLGAWDEIYWERFEGFLKATHDREIIVQIEIWATFDFYRDNWLKNPFNPVNNVNYNERRSKLSPEVSSHPIYTENNFFRSVPSQMAIMRVLEFQQKYVDKILSHTLQYDHVLYCMDNETSVTADWGRFWADYIKKVGRENGRELQTTEMWDPWDLDHLAHRETMDHPEYYTFVDISQNNHNSGETHWSNGIRQIMRLKKADNLRPCNNVKIYGNDGGRHQTTRNGIESFIRNVMFGSASARFHRPTSGQGLNDVAQNVIRSVRSVTDEMDFFNGEPLDELIIEKEPNEAYCRGIIGKEYMVYFTDGGSIRLNLKMDNKNLHLSWMDVSNSKWSDVTKLPEGEIIDLECPESGNWIALIN